MEYEIHAYLGEANAPEESNYPEGERHPIITFFRQECGSKSNVEAATKATSDLGWAEAEFKKSGVFRSLEAIKAQNNEEYLEQYLHALENGCSLMVFGGVFKKTPSHTS